MSDGFRGRLITNEERPIKNKYIFDFAVTTLDNNTSSGGGDGSHIESGIRSQYATDYIIENGKIKVMQSEFTPEEWEQKKDMLEAKARDAFKRNTHGKNYYKELKGFRKVK